MSIILLDGATIHTGPGGSGSGVKIVLVAFREEFIGNGINTQFQLDGTIENAVFSGGSWVSTQIQPLLNSHVVNQASQPIYGSTILGIGYNRINTASISGTGLVTLNYAPQLGEVLDIWYWYELQANDNLGDSYVKEDFVASMEADTINLEKLIATKISKVPSAVNNNIALWDGAGEIKDSGVAIDSLTKSFNEVNFDVTNDSLPITSTSVTNLKIDLTNFDQDITLTNQLPTNLKTGALVTVRKIDTTPYKITFNDGIINYSFINKQGEYLSLLWTGTKYVIN